MLLQPQEVEVFYILPAIRKELAIALKEAGMTQKDIASLLGVSPAAVSQYFHEKRAQTEFPEELKNIIRKEAVTVKDQRTMITATQHILEYAKRTKLICRLHEKVADIPRNCEACFK